MTRTRRFVGGVSVGVAHQVVVTAVGLWLTPFLLGRLGAHDYGLWLTSAQLIAYLTLLDIGVLALLPRDVAYETGRAGGVQHASDLADVIGRTAHIVVWQLPIIAAITWAAWFLLPVAWQPLRFPLAILLVAFVVTYPLADFPCGAAGVAGSHVRRRAPARSVGARHRRSGDSRVHRLGTDRSRRRCHDDPDRFTRGVWIPLDEPLS